MQFLHGGDRSPEEWESALDTFWKTFSSKPGVQQYARTLIAGVIEHRDELDEQIDSALKNWTPERVGRIERNVLRIALFEMAYADDVPSKVAINEAIEIVKSYCADDAPRFINGVLDRLKETGLRQVEP